MAHKIGIFAHYQYGESALAACSLADLAASIGLSVEIYSPGGPTDGIHFRWDDAVRGPADCPFGFRGWAATCRQIVWFGASRTHLSESRDAGCHNVLVVQPALLNQTDLADIADYDLVICPSEAASRWVRLRSRVQSSRLAVLPWDSSAPVTGGPVGRPAVWKILVAADEHSKEATQAVFAALPKRTTQARELHFGRGPAATTSAALQPDYRRRLALYRAANWMIDLRGRSDFGIVTTEALACGLPTVAITRPQTQDMLGEDGLVACPSIKAPDQVTLADVPSIPAIIEDLFARDEAIRLFKGSWPKTENRRRLFQEFWLARWKGTDAV